MFMLIRISRRPQITGVGHGSKENDVDLFAMDGSKRKR